MAKRQSPPGIGVREALDQIAALVAGDARAAIVDELLGAREGALAALRKAMRTHRWPAGGGPGRQTGGDGGGWGDLRGVVAGLDAPTRAEGLHVLHGWDFRAQRRPSDIAPVLLVDYCERLGVPEARLRRAVALLVDQYFLQLLMLPVVRAWDDGDPGPVLDRITGILRELNGPGGAGQAIVDDAETLLMLAVAYYHPEESAYDQQLDRVRTLHAGHALRFARSCTSIMSGHLRWGLRFMYRNDVGTMRDDNVVDYPWSQFALLTLLRAYAGAGGAGGAGAAGGAGGDAYRLGLAEAILDGLSPDPWAFNGARPACLAGAATEHEEFRGRLDAHRARLLDDFEAVRLRATGYAPLGLSCNFLSNAVVASVVTAVADPAAPGTSLNALFVANRDGDPGNAAGEALAERLMRYAAGDRHRLGAGGVPLIVYDRRDAAHFHNAVVRTLAT